MQLIDRSNEKHSETHMPASESHIILEVFDLIIFFVFHFLQLRSYLTTTHCLMDRLHCPSNDRSSRWTLPTFNASKSYQALFGSGSGASRTSGAGLPFLRGSDRILHVVDSNFSHQLARS